MARTKSDASTEITVRWRGRHEIIIRLKRDALFFNVQWNELASAVLHRFSTDQEKKRKDIVPGPVEDMPSQKYPRIKDLPPFLRAQFVFYSDQLAQLERATSMEQRAAIAEREFVAADWLPMVERSIAHEQRPALENHRGYGDLEPELTDRL